MSQMRNMHAICWQCTVNILFNRISAKARCQLFRCFHSENEYKTACTPCAEFSPFTEPSGPQDITSRTPG